MFQGFSQVFVLASAQPGQKKKKEQTTQCHKQEGKGKIIPQHHTFIDSLSWKNRYDIILANFSLT